MDGNLQFDPLLADLVQAILRLKGDRAQALRTGHLSRAVELWKSRDVLEFLDKLRAAENDDYMGLGVAPCPLGSSSFIIDLGSRCLTLRDAIEQSFRFAHMVTGALHFELEEHGDLAGIVIRREDRGHAPSDILADWHMIVWHKFPQRLIGAQILLERAEFDHPLKYRYQSYSGMFNTHCTFNNESSRLVFSRHLLDSRVVLRPDDARQIRSATSDFFSQPPGLATTWTQRIGTILRTEIEAGRKPSTLDELAGEFGVSPQTLRRKLRQEGAHYRSLKAAARSEAALDVLTSKDATIQDASFAAGFSDPGALSRALRTGAGSGVRDLKDMARSWIES